MNDNSTSICVTQAKENYRKIAECLNVYFHNSLDCIFYVSFPKSFSFFRNESNGGPLYKSHHSDGMDTAKSSCILFRLSLIHIYIFTVLIYINVSFKILYFDEVFIKMQYISLNDIYTLLYSTLIIYTTIRLEFKYFEMNLLTFKISSAFNHLS